MTMQCRQQDVASNMVLIALLVVACVAGIPPIVDVLVQSYAESKANGVYACRACGVVENVREVTLDSARNGNSSISGEGFAMLFALLKGNLPDAPVTVYDVEVLLQDGSVRVIREGTPPEWKPGDQVTVMMGKVKPVP
jgi:hypothetical protein